MAATTTLLGLVTPTQGTLSGTWGDTVNYGISDYVDIAVAGTLTLTGDGAVTLANTTGSSSGSSITSSLTGAGTVTAQFAIVNVTGTLTVAKVVTGPSYSKTYTVVNAATGGIVTFKASGQTGVSVAVGESAFVYFNGTDYVKVAGTAAVSSFSAGTTGLTPNTATTGAVTLAGTLAVANGGTGLTAGTSGGVLAYTATGTLASSTALAASALVIGGGAGAAPSTTTTGTGVVTALGVNTGSAGAFVVNGGALGTPASGTVTNLTGTASININGTVGATTATTGAFTTVTASGTLTLNSSTTNDTILINRVNTSTNGITKFQTASVDKWIFGLRNTSDDDLHFYSYAASGDVAVLTSTGLNSTAIGATTPAAGSFTTLSASGTGDFISNTGATTSAKDIYISNTGGGFYLAVDNSVGNFVGGTAVPYRSILAMLQSTRFDIATNNAVVASFSTTGLNSTVIGATTPAAGSFTTIRSSTGSSGAIFGGGSSSNEVVTITAQAGGLGIGLGIQNSSSNLSGISFPTNASATTSYTYITADGRSGANGFIKSYVNDAVVSNLTSTGLAVTGTLSATHTGGTYGLEVIRSGADSVRIFGAAAGSGGRIDFLNNAGSDYEPAVIAGETVELHYRSGVGVSTAGATVSSTGLAVTGTLSASEDIGIAVTPTRTSPNYRSIEIGYTGTALLNPTNGNDLHIVSNSSWLSITGQSATRTGAASEINAGPTYINFNFAPSVTAGSAQSFVETVLISPTGLAVTNLLDISAATAGQIKFPATQNASANANTLDDYEEGTWTPTVTSASYTASATAGTYTKIGRLVYCRFNIIFSAVNGSSNSSCIIGGFPFANGGASNPGVARDDTNTGTIYMLYIDSTAVTGSINSYSGVANGSARILATGENYICSITYQA